MSQVHNYPLTFDGTRLDQLTGVSVINYNGDRLPRRQIRNSKIARVSRSVVTSGDYTEKPITADLSICGTGRQNTQEIWGNVKRICQPLERSLVIPQYDLDIQYICSLNATSEEWLGPQLEARMEFIASDPFGYDTEETTLLDEDNNTSGDETFEIEVEGTALEQLPVYQIFINSVTGGSDSTITLETEAGNISITRDWENGDTLNINSITQTVSVNAGITDYEGRIPRLTPETQDITYKDDFGTRDVDITVVYNKRFV